MHREALGEFEHQVLLAILRLGKQSYSVPIVLEIEECTGKEVAPRRGLHRAQATREEGAAVIPTDPRQ